MSPCMPRLYLPPMKTLRPKLRLVPLLILLIGTAAGCGNRGPLVLPKPEPASTPAKTAAPANEAPRG